MRLEDHPTVRRLSQKVPPISSHSSLDAAMLRQLALDRGADDAGLVELDRPALEPQRQEILRNYPWTRSLLSFVVRMARESVRGAPRSVANLEFHHAGHKVDGIASAVVTELENRCEEYYRCPLRIVRNETVRRRTSTKALPAHLRYIP